MAFWTWRFLGRPSSGTTKGIGSLRGVRFEQPSDSLVRQLNEIIFKACESSPEERYASAHELAAALRAVLPRC